ncbi:MAG TPA: rhodanese-like domain-containing protein [Pedococcus sp.]|jgi:rhodanese-related sulfurtransferase|uniref:rhodanese-like domain-containing protein n=1 Tax=Pedococcus sp. TaxID=2860345 RepID=UPI002F94A360
MSGVDDLVAAARAGLRRLTPAEAAEACDRGALLVDTRTAAQRARQGELPGAVVIDRTVLEWRLDPTGRWRIPELTSAEQVVIVVCSQGYSSSLAAASLQKVGLPNATDLVGGALAWIEAGLPVSAGPADVRE